ncbi:pimeloyl-ACP methyl ester carboxylesterase [Rhabdobacter roseus]|uniref:Pimeloyl-ACP methyl ester carboxylesterase n=1 Tax=Rhabdobacter roseus TaxID=1655419 RepID=A0A840U5L0_9BACT|nr:alpha/beta fold hydrolase [Rhabdobacter roseus]MBB5287109.1 pimeloyl-ACP methyl ester carboxylesterase [Rhabdobacter roseus]
MSERVNVSTVKGYTHYDYGMGGPTRTINPGEPVTLTANCPTNPVWSTGDTGNSLIVAPTSPTTYTLSCPASSASGNCVVKMEYEVRMNSAVQHYHQVSNHPPLNQRQLLASTSGAGTFKVCADGSEASIFKLSGGNRNYSQANITLPSPASIYGSLTVLSRTADSLVMRYKHPEFVNSEAPYFAFTANVSIPGTSGMQFFIEVNRAPVLMVHGLWSDRTSFAMMEQELLKDELYTFDLVRRVDYSATNNKHFAENSNVIPRNITDLLSGLRGKNISAGSVDIVGHSMGGILSRLYLQSDNYRSDIHKLVTINTPHSGSQMANFLLDISNQRANEIACANVIKQFFTSNNSLCDEGAVDDLRVNSTAIDQDLNGSRLNDNMVPSHTIVTAEYATPEEVNDFLMLKDKTFSLGWILDAFGSYRTGLIFFPDIENDLIVSASSQKGGLTGACTTSIPNQIHMGAPGNQQVILAVKRLLRSDPQGGSFCMGFDPVALDYNPQSPTFPTQGKGASTSSTASISITSPEKGSYWEPGNQVPIAASGSGLSNIRTIVRYSYDSVYVAMKAGSTAQYVASAGAYVGKREVMVLGETPSGEVVSDTSFFYVATNLCQSKQTGAWENTTTWTCGRVPLSSDIVIIHSGHTVSLASQNAEAREIIYKGGAINFTGPNSKVLIQGKESP